MEYINRILIVILVGLIYILPGYSLHRMIVGTFPHLYKYSLITLTLGLLTFPLGNILVRWKLNAFTSFIELLGGIFLYIYTFAVLYLLIHLILKFVPNFDVFKVKLFIGYFVAVGILGIWGYYRATTIRVNTYNLKSEKISKNIKILMFADIHLSQVSRKDIVNKIQKVVDERKPDLILIAGDIIDTDVSLIRYDYTKDFQKIKAPLGVYASVGNHEYYGDFNKNLEYIRKLGVNVLYEEGKEVGDFYLAGRSYTFGNRKNIEELSKGNINSKELIVLDHNPKESDELIKSKGFLQVSGHTHNGQFFPFNLITKRIFKPDWGIRTENGSNIITTCGVGYWAIPIRFPSYTEIVEINVSKN